MDTLQSTMHTHTQKCPSDVMMAMNSIQCWAQERPLWTVNHKANAEPHNKLLQTAAADSLFVCGSMSLSLTLCGLLVKDAIRMNVKGWIGDGDADRVMSTSDGWRLQRVSKELGP